MASWVPTDLTSSSGVDVPSVLGVAGYEYATESSKHVIFQSFKNFHRSINELYCGLDGKWHFTPLTDSASAPYIGSTRVSAYADGDEFNQYQHVIYADENNKLTEIYWQSGDKNITDLSTSSGQPFPILSSVFEGYAFGSLQSIFVLMLFGPPTPNLCRLERAVDDDYWAFTNLSQTAAAILPSGTTADSFPAAFMTTDVPNYERPLCRP